MAKICPLIKVQCVGPECAAFVSSTDGDFCSALRASLDGDYRKVFDVQ